jgi:hypothetical protein
MNMLITTISIGLVIAISLVVAYFWVNAIDAMPEDITEMQNSW